MEFVTQKENNSYLKEKKKRRYTTKEIVFVGLLSALSYVLMLLESPPFIGFLRLEFSDIPAIIGAFSYGPMAGVLIELIKNLIKAITASKTAFVGELANFIISVAYVVPAGIFIRKLSGKYKIPMTFAIATISMTVIGFITNYFVTVPMYANLYGGMEGILAAATMIPGINDKFTLILYGITPFNLVKGIFIGIVGHYTYKGIRKVL